MRRTFILGLAVLLPCAAVTVSEAQAGKLTDRILGRIAARKQDRVFHAEGTAYHGTLLNRGKPTSAAFVRVSRASGKPNQKGLFGLAIKLPDYHGKGADQDILLLSSAGSGIAGRRLPWPAANETAAHRGEFSVYPSRPQTYSTVLPFELQGMGRGRIIAEVQPSGRRDPSGAQENLAQLFFARGRNRISLGEVTFGGMPLSDAQQKALTFNPWNTSRRLLPSGAVNRLRFSGYAAGQKGRGAEPNEAARSEFLASEARALAGIHERELESSKKFGSGAAFDVHGQVGLGASVGVMAGVNMQKENGRVSLAPHVGISMGLGLGATVSAQATQYDQSTNAGSGDFRFGPNVAFGVGGSVQGTFEPTLLHSAGQEGFSVGATAGYGAHLGDFRYRASSGPVVSWKAPGVRRHEAGVALATSAAQEFENGNGSRATKALQKAQRLRDKTAPRLGTDWDSEIEIPK